MAVVGYGLLFVVFFLSMLLGSSVAIYWSYTRARRKGYRPPGATLIVLLGIAAGISATVALHPQNTTSVPLFLWRFFWLPMLLSAAALELLVLILPRRTVRVFGERKTHFPFRGLGRLLKITAVASVVLVAIAWMSHSSDFSGFLKSVTFGTALWAAGAYLIRRGKEQQHVPPLEDALQADPRPPVLYLRAFNQESQFFIIGTKAEYGRWAKGFQAAISTADQKIGITVEEYLADDLNTSIGPFVALGSPEDYVAPPGALRLYAKDDEWKSRFDELARRAACVIVEVSKSANLRWEFEHLRTEGLQEKLFILTRPSTEGSRFGWAFWELLWRVKGIRPMKWPEFSSEIKKLGYEIKFADPGAGAVLGFDAHGEAFVLTAGANWPQDFVGPIHAWIAEHAKIGLCAAAKCSQCSRDVYGHVGETAPVCYDCRVGASGKKRAWLRVGVLLWGILIVAVPFVVTVILAMIFPGPWVDRWSGWLFMSLLVLAIVIATLMSGRKKTRSAS
jgi:hypothetical protein